MSQGPLCPNLTKKFQKEVSQMVNRNLEIAMLLGGLSVNLNHLIKSKNVLLLHQPHHYHSTTMAHSPDHQSQPSVLSDPHHPQINTILCQRHRTIIQSTLNQLVKAIMWKVWNLNLLSQRHIAGERSTVPGDFKTEIMPQMAMKRATDGFKWFYNISH